MMPPAASISNARWRQDVLEVITPPASLIRGAKLWRRGFADRDHARLQRAAHAAFKGRAVSSRFARIAGNQNGALMPSRRASITTARDPVVAPLARPGCGCRRDEADYFLLGAWPAGVLPEANGEGVAPPFLMFLSAFGFFFSLLLRI
jgi:hypothetical protein